MERASCLGPARCPEHEPHLTPRHLPPMATRFLPKSSLPSRDRHGFCTRVSQPRTVTARVPSSCAILGQSSRWIPVGAPARCARGSGPPGSARYRSARHVVYRFSDRERPRREHHTGDTVETSKPIHRRRELHPHSAEQSCWHQRDVEFRKVAAKAKSGFDVLAQSRICKSLNQRQRSPGGILII